MCARWLFVAFYFYLTRSLVSWRKSFTFLPQISLHVKGLCTYYDRNSSNTATNSHTVKRMDGATKERRKKDALRLVERETERERVGNPANNISAHIFPKHRMALAMCRVQTPHRRTEHFKSYVIFIFMATNLYATPCIRATVLHARCSIIAKWQIVSSNFATRYFRYLFDSYLYVASASRDALHKNTIFCGENCFLSILHTHKIQWFFVRFRHSPGTMRFVMCDRSEMICELGECMPLFANANDGVAHATKHSIRATHT